MIYCGVPANQWASSGVAIAIRKDCDGSEKLFYPDFFM